jgi:uncharacterized repeat protein (TIGR03803 family)
MRTRAASGITLAALLVGCGGSQPPIGATPEAIGPNTSNGSVEETVLYSFAGGSDGAYPVTAPILDGGKLYGTTTIGGKGGCIALKGCGTIYELSLRGSERVLYAFKGGTDGEAPGGLLPDGNGNLLGTTVYGGGLGCKSRRVTGCGTVFELSPSHKERVLYRFAGKAKGAAPVSLVRLSADFYGELAAGGIGKCAYASYSGLPGCGLIFRLSSSGNEQLVYEFKGGNNGATPSGGLVPFKGNFYGTTSAGGHSCYYFGPGCGTVFRVTLSGGETILHAFRGSWHDGAVPTTGVAVLDGIFYGTTASGGSHNCGLTYYLPCGTVFKITPSGEEQIIYNFKGGTDGADPNGLIAVNGTLYGTTQNGGSTCGCGTVFSLTPSGGETILYRFRGGSDAAFPRSGLVDVAGTLYGTTLFGGSHDDGAVYAIAR